MSMRKPDEMPHAILGGDPGAILDQEAAGAAELRIKSFLPVQGTQGREEEWEKVGVTFGPVPDDDIFREAFLPEGWVKESDSHDPRHMVIRDAKGRVRATMFYKAAFYDRKANVNLRSRYSIRQHYDAPDGTIQWQVYDCETVIHTVERKSPSREKEPEAYYELLNKLYRNDGGARDWLDKEFPDWRDPTAYWEDA